MYPMTDIPRRTALSALLGSAAGAAPGRRPPNIVFVFSDQHIGHVLGANGHPAVRTPNLDRLARMGVNYRTTYCNSPLCAPARAAIMSGMFPSDVDSFCNATVFDGRVPAWTNRLQQAGYHCWSTGKLDIKKNHDWGHEAVNTGHSHDQKPDIACLLRNPVCFLPGAREKVDGWYDDEEHPDARLFRDALGFLERRAPSLGKPWAVYVGPHAPHPKWHALTKYREMYPAEKMPLPQMPAGYLERRHPTFQIFANYRQVSLPIPDERVRRIRSVYYGMVTELDAMVGSLMAHLDKTNQWDNTVFVYSSDHGEMLGEHGLWCKNVLLDYSARVPLILAGAGLPKGKVVDTPVSHVDLVATLLDAAGVEKPRGLRGHSVLPLARGEQGSHPGFAYSESHSDGQPTGSFLIRKGKWKYIYFTGDSPLLYDIEKDPGEYHDLAGKLESQPILKELHAHLTSLVDPDAITHRAFDVQEQRLADWVRTTPKEKFYQQCEDRLGGAQTRTLTDRLYRRRALAARRSASGAGAARP